MLEASLWFLWGQGETRSGDGRRTQPSWAELLSQDVAAVTLDREAVIRMAGLTLERCGLLTLAVKKSQLSNFHSIISFPSTWHRAWCIRRALVIPVERTKELPSSNYDTDILKQLTRVWVQAR